MSDTIQVSRAEMLALKTTLLSLREALEVTSVALDKALTAKAEGVETVADAPAPPTVKAEKKPRTNKGKSTAHGDYTKFVMQRYPMESAEQKKFLDRRIVDAAAGKIVYTADHCKVKSGKRAVGDLMSVEEAKVGPHLAFVSERKKQQQAEWLSFEAQWNEHHPKGGSRASSVTGDTSEAGSAVEGSGTEAKEEKPKRGRKPMTQGQKDAAKAKREAKKAAVEFDPLASQWA